MKNVETIGEKTLERDCDTPEAKKHRKLAQKKLYRIDEAEHKVGSLIRHGIETGKKVRGRAVILSRNDRIAKVEGEKVTTAKGVELSAGQKVGSRSNIEKHGDWNVIKEDGSFGSAFAAARAAGLQTFDFGGKSFNTRKAGESDSKWKGSLKPSAPIPAPRLDRNKVRPANAGPSGNPANDPKPVVKVAPKPPVSGLNVPKGPMKPNAGPSKNPANDPKPLSARQNQVNNLSSTYVTNPIKHSTDGGKGGNAAGKDAAQSAVNKAADRLRLKLTLNKKVSEGLVYAENEPFSGNFNPNKVENPNAIYKKHLENHHYLQFIQHNSKDAREKIQAGKEMGMADKKMNYWSKHPLFDKKQAERDHSEVKKKWTVKEAAELDEISKSLASRYIVAAGDKLQKLSKFDSKNNRAVKKLANGVFTAVNKYHNQKDIKVAATEETELNNTIDETKLVAGTKANVTNYRIPQERSQHTILSVGNKHVKMMQRGKTKPTKFSKERILKANPGRTFEEVETMEEAEKSKEKDHMVNCPSCKGHGKKMDRYDNFDICDDCDGKGKVSAKSLAEKVQQDGVYRAKTAATKKFNDMTGHEHKGVTYWNNGKKGSPLTGKHPGKAANGKYKLRAVEELIAKRYAELSEISRAKARAYRDAATDDFNGMQHVRKFAAPDVLKLLNHKGKMRVRGIARADDKMGVTNGSYGKVKVKEEFELDEAKLIATHTSSDGKKVAKVYRDSEWDEYHVKHYTDGKHHTKADYHTDDKDDAHGTAKHFVKEEVLGEISKGLGIRYLDSVRKKIRSLHQTSRSNYAKGDDGAGAKETNRKLHKHELGFDMAANKLDGYAKVNVKGQKKAYHEEVEIEEGKSFKNDNDAGYKARKGLRDKVKKYAADRREGKSKRQVAEAYPEVRSLNKKKKPSPTAAKLEPTGIR